MHEMVFLKDLAVVMIVAGIITVVFHRLKQPVVLGYIVAGVIIGPHALPFPLIEEEQTIRTLANLGIIFLMFSLGLEFNLRKLRQVGATAFIAATLEIVVMIAIGYGIGQGFGWSAMNSLFLGAMISISSTTIIVKALRDLGKSKEKFGEIIFGILIVEDLLAILIITLLSGIARTGSLKASEVFLATGQLIVFLVAAVILGLLVVPRLLGYIARFKSDEVLLITVLGLCLGMSLLAVKLNYSVALGAFVIGAIMAEAREIGKVEALTGPIRDMFSAVFFVTIGLLINPAVLWAYAVPIVVITVAVVVGQVVSCAFGTFLAGHDSRTSLRVGMGLAQIGEFSFIIAALGSTLKVTGDFLYPIAVAVSAITTLLIPYLIRSADRLVDWFHRVAPRTMVGYMELYPRWVSQLAARRKDSMERRLVKKWLLQMALNQTLVAGIFLAAAVVASWRPPWLPPVRGGHHGLRTALWLGAMLVSLPLLIATLRKLQAFGMLVSEVIVRSGAAGPRTSSYRAFIANAITVTGLIVMVLLIVLLSSTLLPPVRLLIFLGLLIVLLTVLLWRSFVKIYSKAQVALRETLAQPPPAPEREMAPLLGLLQKAKLEVVPVPTHSPASGKLIRELKLRTVTGASIVGIERDGTSIINPGPDEEVLAGDQVLLLGTREQLAHGRALLVGEEPEPVRSHSRTTH